MTDESDQPPTLISARDSDLAGIIPAHLLQRYEIQSYRNAARILASAFPSEFAELLAMLEAFTINTADIVAGGKNKSRIARRMDELLNPEGWFETRIRGHMLVETTTAASNPEFGKRRSEKKVRNVQRHYKIENVIDGHKIDFVKGRVAFDLEWNSKDQTFDRDLYAMRAFYDAGIIGAGVLLTRDATLGPLFAEIGSRVMTDKFASKYGASTTWMGKLTYRLDAGRAGGCPILAIGIKPAVVEDFDDWKKANPVVRAKVDLGDLAKPAVGDEEE